MPEQKELPNPDEVKKIFKFTYLLYEKYITQKDIDWDLFHEEYTALCNQYGFDLTVKIIDGLVQLIGLQKGGL